MQTPTIVIKDLEKEASIKDHIAYFPIMGASKIDNFKAPEAYVFLFFERAKGTHSIDFIEYTKSASQIHISFPEQIHSWDTKSNCIGHKLIVSKYFIEKIMYDAEYLNHATNEYPVLKLKKDNFSDLVENLKVIARELTVKNEEINWKIVNLRARLILMIVNTHIAKRVPRGRKRANGHIITIANNFKELLEKHMKESRSVAFYSKRLYVTPNYLGIVCTKVFGKSAKAVINQRIAQEARRMLLSTNDPIKEISYELGFSDLPNFSAFIKLHIGIRPKELRQGKFSDISSPELETLP